MGGRSTSDNFKRRFGDPPRIALKFDKKKASFVEEADVSKKMAEAAINIMRGVLGRKPTEDEILGKVIKGLEYESNSISFRRLG